MIQFYAPEIEKENILPEGESAHCVRVLRLKEGDDIVVTDGKGQRFLCEITKAHPSKTEFRIKEKTDIAKGRDYRVTLAVAPTKNSDRMEWLMEKAVEIGVDKIVLLKCDRSERKVLRTDRLQKIIVSAMKQSLSAHLPELVEITPLKEFVAGCGEIKKYFGYCSPEYPRKEFAKEYCGREDVVIMIGPEGDFTPEEVEISLKSGFMPVTFGEKRLRTETAGVYALCGVDLINQRLK